MYCTYGSTISTGQSIKKSNVFAQLNWNFDIDLHDPFTISDSELKKLRDRSTHFKDEWNLYKRIDARLNRWLGLYNHFKKVLDFVLDNDDSPVKCNASLFSRIDHRHTLMKESPYKEMK